MTNKETTTDVEQPPADGRGAESPFVFRPSSFASGHLADPVVIPAEPVVALALRRDYEADFALTADYQTSLPDLMVGDAPAAGGDGADASAPLAQVGISGFRLPLRFAVLDKGGEPPVTLETRVVGTVGLAAGTRAINMSRIIRTFYEFQDRTFTVDLLPEILARMRATVGCTSARLRLEFSFPLLQPSLRSGEAGYQFYDAAFEAELPAGGGPARRQVRLDFVYSSACPCSTELSEHAREVRQVFAIPHSQRSRARVWAVAAPGATLAVEDLQAACLRALRTETQVIVRRTDEQAFAELNGAHVKFVEDAARLLHAELAADGRIADFQAACVHLESLHSHDAVAVVCKGVPGGFRGDFGDFGALAR